MMLDQRDETTDAGTHPGVVLCVVSAKGGSGKTILAATMASMLMRAGKRVVVIDTDFSTRGLSLYLLDSLTYARQSDIRPENCLADALLHDIPAERVRPIVVPQAKGEFHIILPNSDFRRGGAPEDLLLRLGQSGPMERDFESKYVRLLRALCDQLRREYDYVVIDTRGGYDYSSKVPAVIADAFAIVVEADPISVQQVNGLKSRIDEFSRTAELTPNHAGYIINKALFSPEEGTTFADGLARLYGGRTFGIIPADRSAISAYQTRDIPYQKHAGSDFSYYSFQAIEQFVSATCRASFAEDAAFRRLKARIRREWSIGRALQRAQEQYPNAILSLLALSSLAAYVYSQGARFVSSQAVMACLAALVVAALSSPTIGAWARLRQAGAPQLRAVLTSAIVPAMCVGALALAAPRVQAMLEGNLLLLQAQRLQATLADVQGRLSVASTQLARSSDETSVLRLERERLAQQLKLAQAQLTSVNTSRQQLQIELARASRTSGPDEATGVIDQAQHLTATRGALLAPAASCSCSTFPFPPSCQRECTGFVFDKVSAERLTRTLQLSSMARRAVTFLKSRPVSENDVKRFLGSSEGMEFEKALTRLEVSRAQPLLQEAARSADLADAKK